MAKRKPVPRVFLTKDRVKMMVKTCSNLKEFREKYPSAYVVSLRDGYYREVAANLPRLQKPHGYWNEARSMKKAKLCKTRHELVRRFQVAYNNLRRLGVLDDACAHMEPQGHRYKRRLYVFEFSDKSAYVGLSFDPEGRFNEHFTKKSVVGRHADHHDFEYHLASKFMSHTEAALAEQKLIDQYRQKGWKILNRKTGGGLGGTTVFWDYESLKALASKYDSVKLFRTTYPGAYVVACRKGFWPEISSHMTALLHGRLREQKRRRFLKGR